MKNFGNGLSMLLIALLLSCQSHEGPVIEFRNGQWFDGQGFVSKTLYSVNGVLRANQKGQVDSVVDLENGYVIPPFGDAHTHNLADPQNVNEMTEKYLKDGVFYVQVLTNYASKADSLRERFSNPETLDIQYAQGGITATLGHPHLAYETSAMGLHWSAIFSQRERIKNSRIAENDAYWFLDKPEDVGQKWPEILKTQPDLIKIYLINTGQHQDLSEKEQMGKFGLSEEVARLVVEKAHQAGLKVYAHVENAYDFRVGLRIGVDGYGHLPGYSWDGKENPDSYRLTDNDIALARERDVVIVPTANFARVYAMKYDNQGKSSLDTIRYHTVNQFLNRELRRLRDAGIKIALGADQLGETSILEADYLVKDLKAFDPLTTLKLLSQTTPQVIYPDRQLGELKEGFEASFLVLNGNPLEDWDQIHNIELAVKHGVILP